jgi:hypothetical protein
MSFAAHLASGHFDVVKSDTDQPKTFYGLYVGTLGDVVVKSVDGVVCTYKGVQGNLPVKGIAVMAATTAADIVGYLK